jgi:hypothetical protein
MLAIQKIQLDACSVVLTFRRRHADTDGGRVRRNSKLVTPAVDESVADLSSPATIYTAGARQQNETRKITLNFFFFFFLKDGSKVKTPSQTPGASPKVERRGNAAA